MLNSLDSHENRLQVNHPVCIAGKCNTIELILSLFLYPLGRENTVPVVASKRVGFQRSFNVHGFSDSAFSTTHLPEKKVRRSKRRSAERTREKQVELTGQHFLCGSDFAPVCFLERNFSQKYLCCYVQYFMVLVRLTPGVMQRTAAHCYRRIPIDCRKRAHLSGWVCGQV